MLEFQSVEKRREYIQKAHNVMLAFLNTDGGTFYIGISSEGNVYGIEGDIDEFMQDIVRGFRDSVTPDPSGYFNVEPEKRDDKNVLAITVSRGSAIPYCYSEYGLMPQGVYVRVAKDIVMADRERIRKMIEDNGPGQFIDELSIEQNLTFDYAEKFFTEKDIKFDDEQKISLGLFRPDGRYTNLALILSDQCPYSTKTSIFEGTTKEKFKDHKEFTGSVLKQIEEVYTYLHVFNRSHSRFEGFERIDYPDYPPVAIRESYTNSLLHRDYSIEGSVLVSMFDDRLEFMSLGGVMPGVTYQLMLVGVSVPRNEKLAQIFHRLNLIETFGTGIPRIFGAYENCDTKPEIPIIDDGFLIQIPNMNHAPQSKVHDHKIISGSNEQRVLAAFAGKSFTKEDASEVLGISVNGAYKLLQRMKERGMLALRKDGKRFVYDVI